MKTFHKIFYSFMRFCITPYFAVFGRYRWHVYKPKSKNYIVLTNHNTNYDFFLTGLSLPRHMYFVATEAIMRLGWVSSVIRFLADPIPRKKGASGDDTAEEIIRRLKAGANVCMAVEGNRSFDGQTGWISAANAPMVRKSGAGLITYRLHGGYFVNPRWSKQQRRGPMWGEVVREYTPDEIAALSDEELTDIIRRDIYVNAYEDQERCPRPYHCKAAAETLETALFLCPECHRFSTLKSRENSFSCRKCGLTVTLDEYGYFHGNADEKVPFSTILDWSLWQRDYLKEYLPQVKEQTDMVLFGDEHIRLCIVVPEKGAVPVGTGCFTVYPNRLVFSDGVNTREFALDQISHMAVSLTNTLLFTAEREYFQAKSKEPYSALKYMICWRLLRGKEYQ